MGFSYFKAIKKLGSRLVFLVYITGIAGFEPTHDRVKVCCLTAWLYPNVMEGEGFEPSNPKERIYSPLRLATSLSLHMMLFLRFFCSKISYLNSIASDIIDFNSLGKSFLKFFLGLFCRPFLSTFFTLIIYKKDTFE